jgi:hypothetical protein
VSIPASAYCEVASDTGFWRLLVDRAVLPKVAEAILLFGELLFASGRVEKYMTLFKASECLSEGRDADASAIRHGLSHAASVLARPATKAALQRIFGTVSIDLNKGHHLKEFYRHFGLLLIETESLLYAQLLSLRGRAGRLKPGEAPLHDWQVWSGDRAVP